MLTAPLDRVGQCDIGTGDGRGARATISLKHIAVNNDGVLAEGLHVDNGPQASPNQTRDLMSAATNLALNGFAVHARICGARQHGVFGRYPAFALARHPARDAVCEGCGAQHLGAPEGNERRPFGLVAPSAFNRDGAKFVVGAAVYPEGGLSHGVLSSTGAG